METAEILLRSAKSAITFDQAQRVDHLLTLADVFGKVTNLQRNTISLTLNENENVKSDYNKTIEEHEDRFLQSTGLIY